MIELRVEHEARASHVEAKGGEFLRAMNDVVTVGIVSIHFALERRRFDLIRDTANPVV